MVRSLILTPLPGIPVVEPGDDLVDFILKSTGDAGINLMDEDIFVLAQKIVSKMEGRIVNLETISPSQQAIDLANEVDKDPRIVELILRDSNEILRTRKDLIIVEHRLGFVCANAGIDRSNASSKADENESWVVLLPENPDKSAEFIRNRIEKATGKRIGISIIDSHGRAWRMGVVGLTIGIAGLPGVWDLRGKADLNDYILQNTEVGVADELAAAASLMMGQAAEGTPVVHARGFPYPLRDGSLNEILRPKNLDLFR